MMAETSPGSDLLLVLERSRNRGFLGPGPVEFHVAQARSFGVAVGGAFRGRAVDLGSGGGVPGLVLAGLLPTASWLLLDASLQRVRFLEGAVRQLGLTSRVEVRHGRAEDLGRDPDWRGTCDAVVARSFGPPAVVAECAAPLLRVGGGLVVSEPPEPDGERWPSVGLSELGLVVRLVGPRSGYRMAEMQLEVSCPDRFPRRAGVPARAPLF
jgi:16S rRNA (guanine527-N7)-methyltransferase